MPVKRRLAKRRTFDDYKWEELLTGEAPLLPGLGYFKVDAASDSGRCADMRDRQAMRRDWEIHREELVAQWIGELPRPQNVPWVFPLLPNPRTRPWAWWEFDAPEPLGDHEDEADYLRRLGLMRPGEEDLPDWRHK